MFWVLVILWIPMKAYFFLIISLMTFLTTSSLADLHRGFEQLLSEHVKGASVDYKGLNRKVGKLDDYLKKLKKVTISELNKNEVMALYINSYNACTLKLILNHYPIDSINDISISKRWKWKGWNIAGETLSLDEIEHVKLRPMGDPRIHFVINCASVSCPVLLPEAIVATKLNHQLDRATKSFLNDELRGMTLKESSSFLGFDGEKKVHVSKIFSWFGSDFVKAEGSVSKFIKNHVQGKNAAIVKDLDSDNDLSYLDYDWNLNAK